METINEAQYEQRHLESCKGYDCVEKYCDRYVEENYREVLLPSGSNLEILDLTWLNDLSTQTEHDRFEPLVAKFYLSGSLRTITPRMKDKYVKDDYLEQAGENYLFYLPNIKEIEQATAGTLEFLIRISFDQVLRRVQAPRILFMGVSGRGIYSPSNLFLQLNILLNHI